MMTKAGPVFKAEIAKRRHRECCLQVESPLGEVGGEKSSGIRMDSEQANTLTRCEKTDADGHSADGVIVSSPDDMIQATS